MARCIPSESCSATAVRSNNQPLFPSLSEGKRYYIRVEVNDEIGSYSINSDVRFEWNQNSSPFESKVSSICTILPIILLMSSQKTYPHVNSQTSTNSYPSNVHLCTMATPANGPFVHYYFKLPRTATSPQHQQPPKQVPNYQNNLLPMTSLPMADQQLTQHHMLCCKNLPNLIHTMHYLFLFCFVFCFIDRF